MSGAPELLRHAQLRAESLRDRYRAEGLLVAAAGRRRASRGRRTSHPAGVGRQDDRTDLCRPRRTDRPGLPCDGRGRGGGVDADRPGRRQRCGLGGGRARRAASRRGGPRWCPAPRGRPRWPTSSAAPVPDTARHRTGRPSVRPSCRDCAPGSGLGDAEPGEVTRHQPQRGGRRPAFVLYTSGTTSRPKGVIHSLSTLIKASANYIAATGVGRRRPDLPHQPARIGHRCASGGVRRPDAVGARGARRSLGSGYHV